jgi:hypothetical protein
MALGARRKADKRFATRSQTFGWTRMNRWRLADQAAVTDKRGKA